MRASFRFALAVGTIALLLGSAVPVVASQATTTYALSGDAVFPEGIAFDQRTGDFYVTSTQDGSIQRGNVNTSAATPFIAGSGAQFASIGLELDAGRLAVAGGNYGRGPRLRCLRRIADQDVHDGHGRLPERRGRNGERRPVRHGLAPPDPVARAGRRDRAGCADSLPKHGSI